jgi:hypothetical protein
LLGTSGNGLKIKALTFALHALGQKEKFGKLKKKRKN